MSLEWDKMEHDPHAPVPECCLFLPSDDVSLFGTVMMAPQRVWGGDGGEGEVPLDDLEITPAFPSDVEDVEEDEEEEEPGFEPVPAPPHENADSG